ncbi:MULTISPECIES: cobaltochelatase subunit CobN [Prochlorococcus]|uniref:Cobalamin biosynthesis protein CobN n=1 Tax=Prochlorococcus marinus (strain SARG / CCMP1375 / SS120) TaxID=167539 RepID=Q7VBY5_PROMA|nr:MULTISPECIES: cobaltochelatase subunit CobN [Prochlorococcus]AAQ00002.1 Cobalamin biosynthesis protein CobN [Prochlorococcus marinus subsp. marinus str. CCMP1375]KGG13799.1 CobN component of cobalt chelatase involved in B12 biosynthesis [Prochlorococcus marinus str. LG]KGG18934.1 CobN component of cobalt chelatase involved in B12 biosynthesis [Prochlorococcus marinus str. SS2]KGG23528.1 CobN component of cobalt chelatase involved in B12 biosynthesis [Prochlorococcus marinus str. SS35]KGG322
MHRIANLPSEESTENLALLEQPQAPVLFLTSAASDISTLSYILNENKNHALKDKIRALKIDFLLHNAQVDHYLTTTGSKAQIIVVRYLGRRSDWSYGFEQLYYWSKEDKNRHLIILSGVEEQETELNSIGNITFPLSLKLGKLLRIGGFSNMKTFLAIISKILTCEIVNFKNIKIANIDDPCRWEWTDVKGPKIGLILYSSILNSGDSNLAISIIKILRQKGLNPRPLWVSSLKKKHVQSKVLDIYKEENVRCVLTTTSFASVNFDQASEGKQIWDLLGVPVIQILSSNKQKKEWKDSSRGLDPLDLSLQVVMPELDGRITTKIGGFKKVVEQNLNLYSPVYRINPDKENIKWIADYTKSWVSLQKKDKQEVKIIINLSNYPIKDGRIANGVGLDSPESIVVLLEQLKLNGYYLGNKPIPSNSKQLMKLIINGRTNSLESSNNEPLEYISLDQYLKFWSTFSLTAKQKIKLNWNKPSLSIDLEKKGFPVNGIRFGNIAILIQPSRGYTEDNINDIHSPTLAPPHRYIAQYFWIYKFFKADVMIHMGKHGTAEWLPGKSVGLSSSCFPQLVIPPIPYLYPFIVNDPGEGSQAKRRTHSIIVDHLTPPLARAGLSQQLIDLENLLDEYYETLLLDSDRNKIVKEKLDSIIIKENFDSIISTKDKLNNKVDSIYENLDSYLCELKESQIRTGLHILGRMPSDSKLGELTLAIAMAPTFNTSGISQYLSRLLNINIDPWADNEGDSISEVDNNRLFDLNQLKFRIKGDYITWINNQAQSVVSYYLRKALNKRDINCIPNNLINELRPLLLPGPLPLEIYKIKESLIPSILKSPSNEIKSLFKGINGLRVSSGPSGSPTRGNVEVLPTGKNFYSVDLRCLPTQSAWDLGRKSAEQLCEIYLLEKGIHMSNLAMSVWATSTMRNGGEDICQFLSFLGIRPVWDNNTKKLIDLEVIPLQILGRPRVDVTLRISGLFRDAFPNLIELVNKALDMILNIDEPLELNPLLKSSKNGEYISRIFGSSPEGYGTGLQELINIGIWEETSELANCYLKSSQWEYTNSKEPTLNLNGLKESLKKIQVVLHSQDNREHDLLDSDDYYQFHGGLSAAVKELSGICPDIYFGDNSRKNKPRIHKLEKEIDKVVRSRLLNNKWIEGMKEHGYKGAFELSASLDYLFAYDATTGSVPKWCYSSIREQWLDNDSTKNFLIEQNPWVLRDISERFLEAYNRKMWSASKSELNKIKRLLLEAEKTIEESNY